MFPIDIEALAAELIDRARAVGVTLTTAESCTGGLVGGALTAIAGSSAVFDRGFITYTNAAKAQMLGVDPALIGVHGAVSQPVAEAMAQGALRASGAGLAIAVTGVAGPGGGTADKPVGLVHFAAARRGGATVCKAVRFGDLGRGEVRAQSVRVALTMMLAALA